MILSRLIASARSKSHRDRSCPGRHKTTKELARWVDSAVHYKVWRSNKDKELHLICGEGPAAFNALTAAMRHLGRGLRQPAG